MPDQPDASPPPRAADFLSVEGEPDDFTSGSPPPLPVEPVPVEAIPVEPVPAEPYVPYASAGGGRAGTPSVVVAMGVFSIVVSSVNLLGGGISTMATAVASGTMTARAVRTAGPAVPPVAIPPAVEVLDPNGMPAADRLAVARGLNRARTITLGQQLQLDELLAECGKDVVAVGTPVDPAVVAASVSGSGQLGTLGTAAAAADSTPSYFALSGGRLELTDSRAVFFPGDGQPALRAVAYGLPDLPEGATAPPLSDDAIRSTLRAIARQNGSRPKAAQVAAILSLLRSAGQQVVSPTADGSDPAAEVTGARSDPDGTLTVNATHGGNDCQLTVTPDGRVSAALTLIATAAAVPQYNQTALGFVVILAVVQLVVAVYLLVIGIVTARRSRGGRLLHWIYVGVKLPIGGTGVAAAWWFWHSLPIAGGAAAWGMTPAVLGLVYPLALVFVLCGRTVRAYYGPAVITSGGRRSAPW